MTSVQAAPLVYGQRGQRRRRAPLIISSLVVMSLCVIAFWHNAPNLHVSTDSPLMRQSLSDSSDQAQSQDTTDKEDPQPDPMACFKNHPWIEPALEQFFKPARKSAAASLQTSQESLDAMDEITWIKGYHPGHDRVILRYDDELKRYTMHADMRSPSNVEHKRRCILPLLESAIEAHGAALSEQFDRKELQLVVETEDFGIIWRGAHSKLPAFALCTDRDHTDIPIPDFTFGCYPEAHYSDSSWPAVSDLLHRKSEMLRWRDRLPTIFHRSNWDVGPRRGLMPLLQKLHEEDRDVEVLGAEIDVANTGFTAENKEHFVWLDGQCESMVQLHTSGFSYSAALKYKLACGSLVLKFDSKYVEFFEPALQDGVHVVKLKAEEDGVDEVQFFEESAPKIKAAVEEALSSPMAPAIAAAGHDFVMRNLTSEALNCYWYGALQRYGELYFMEETAAQKAEREKKDRKYKKGSTGVVEVVDGKTVNKESNSIDDISSSSDEDGSGDLGR